MLLIGAGGLGSPAALYLAAAGVGTLGIVDFDVVEASNLQRQVIHSTERLGMKKVDSARQTIQALNPDVNVVAYDEMLTEDNVERLIAGYDVILDGTDTFETRYLLNDAAVAAGIPVVHASVFRFEGQLTMFVPYEGPCYRCLYPTPPPPELAPGCSVAGVLGRRARDHGPAPGERGPQGPARHGRAARRAPAAVRCPRRLVLRAAPEPRSEVPGLLRRGASGTGARRLDGTIDVRGGPAVRARQLRGGWLGDRRRPGDRRPAVSTIKLPSVLRANANGERSIEVEGATVGEPCRRSSGVTRVSPSSC